MMSQSPTVFRRGSRMTAMLTLAALALSTCVLQAETVKSGTGADVSEPEVSIWVDDAPLSLVIRQLAHLSGRTADIEGLSDVPVSGRFSASLGDTLAKLSADYPVVFDVDGEVLRATDSAHSSVSIAMLSSELNDTIRSELQASAGAGNTVEFREDAVRVSGHPTFVKRQASNITRVLAIAEGRSRPDPVAEGAEPESSDITSVADAGSAEVLADIKDEGKPSSDQASLSKPIRWVTDIPGFDTF